MLEISSVVLRLEVEHLSERPRTALRTIRSPPTRHWAQALRSGVPPVCAGGAAAAVNGAAATAEQHSLRELPEWGRLWP